MINIFCVSIMNNKWLSNNLIKILYAQVVDKGHFMNLSLKHNGPLFTGCSLDDDAPRISLDVISKWYIIAIICYL